MGVFGGWFFQNSALASLAQEAKAQESVVTSAASPRKSSTANSAGTGSQSRRVSAAQEPLLAGDLKRSSPDTSPGQSSSVSRSGR